MRANGYAILVDPETGTKECDTHTCAHCQRLVFIPPNKKLEEVGDFCRSCMKVHCLRNECFTCTPILKKIEAEEARYHALRSYV